MKLIIGNKNYSSWSLRPWLLLRHFSLPFDELNVSLGDKNLREILGQFSPAAKVPVLVDGTVTVWDSLAICEYLNEQYLEGRGWPRPPAARAKARAVVAELHSGFQHLRRELPMNCRASRRVSVSDDAKREIARVDDLWSQTQHQELGSWLFGSFSIADCFFAPVALRIQTYGVDLSQPASEYCDHLLNHNAMRAWKAAALDEQEVLEDNEIGENVMVQMRACM